MCQNKQGSYKCVCRKGFFLDGNGRTCSGNLFLKIFCFFISNFAKWSFIVVIKIDEIIFYTSILFSDHDECANSNHGCQHKCENLHGSFKCVCPKGFKLNVDTKTCSGRYFNTPILSESFLYTNLQ